MNTQLEQMNNTPTLAHSILNSDSLGLQAVLDALPIGISIIDSNHKIVFTNKFIRDIVGDKAGESCHKVYHSLGTPHPACPLVDGEPDDIVESIAANGKFLRIKHSTVTEINGETIIIAMIEDITEQKEVNEQLESERKLSRELKMENMALKQLMEIKPVSETSIRQDKKKFALEKKTYYIVKEHKAVRSLEIFSDSVGHGVQGLCVTHQHPDKVRNKWNLETTPIIWLTRNNVEGEHCLDPLSIVTLSTIIQSFLQKTDNGIILFEGLEYLITQNSFSAILKLIQQIADKIMLSNTTLLLSIDPLTLDKKELRLLERDAEAIVEK